MSPKAKKGPTASQFTDETPEAKQAEPMAMTLRVFNIFDIDKNGKIDLTEVKVICKSLNLHPTVVSSIHFHILLERTERHDNRDLG